MKIGIIGAAGMGKALALHLAGAGHDVFIANSRGPESLVALAAEVSAKPVSVVDVARDKDVVVLAIPTKAVAELPPRLFANLPHGVVVIDVCNYHPSLRDGRIEAIEDGLFDSQWVARTIGHPVIKAFNSILAHSLLERAVPEGTTGRIALPVSGDPPEARATVLRLVEAIGFDAVDGGGLEESWRQGTGTPAYCKDLTAAPLRRALAEADRRLVSEYRAREEARIRSMLAVRTTA